MTNLVQSRSGSEILDPALLAQVLSIIAIEKYFKVPIVVISVYYSMTTFDDEINHFWTTPCSSISMIFIVNRYLGLLSAILGLLLENTSQTLIACQVLYWIDGISGLIIFLLIDYILLIRCLALYHRNRRLSVWLGSLLGLDAAIGLGVLIYSNIAQGFTVLGLAEELTICATRNVASRQITIFSWAVPLTFGLTLFMLALYKAVGYWKLSFGFRSSRLIWVVVQDQILYYFFVVICCTLRIVELNLIGISPVVAAALHAVASPTLLSVLGSQLLINLKDAGRRGQNDGINDTPRSISDIQFTRGDR